MKKLDDCSSKVKHATRSMWAKFHHSFLHPLSYFLLFQLNPFLLEFAYFITLSSLCFLTLKSSKTRSTTTTPQDLDLFFTAVSAVTVSSMSTLQMEVFSNTQLLFLTIFMFAGGEVFTSMLHLHLTRAKMIKKLQKTTYFDVEITQPRSMEEEEEGVGSDLKLKSIKILAYLISCYLLVVHALGSTLISLYISLTPSAREILRSKRIKIQIFSIFTAVSTFTNCGFIPTNENMIVFKKNSGLLLILIPHILMGNTLYPVFLRLTIWVLAKTKTAAPAAAKRVEFGYMLENWRELGYGHLLSPSHSLYLAATALAFMALQLVVFCSLEWNSGGGSGGYWEVVAALFQVVNSRHAGESVFDLSAVSPAVLVLFVFMMYLPPYTSYLPTEKRKNISTGGGGGAETTRKIKNKNRLHNIIFFSQLTYLSIFVILICITERHSMRDDPLNFNVLNVVLEVISAYGNVGFTAGYSCERRINHSGQCEDSWSGFAGRWSTSGKFALIVVMFFGRLKKFSKGGGRAWILA